MCYSVESRDGFLSFSKNIGKNISSKYSQKLADSAKKSVMCGYFCIGFIDFMLKGNN